MGNALSWIWGSASAFQTMIFLLIMNCVQVLEWCGVALIDRSFEEVSAVMDRTGDTVELLVEHANDL